MSIVNQLKGEELKSYQHEKIIELIRHCYPHQKASIISSDYGFNVALDRKEYFFFTIQYDQSDSFVPILIDKPLSNLKQIYAHIFKDTNYNISFIDDFIRRYIALFSTFHPACYKATSDLQSIKYSDFFTCENKGLTAVILGNVMLPKISDEDIAIHSDNSVVKVTPSIGLYPSLRPEFTLKLPISQSINVKLAFSLEEASIVDSIEKSYKTLENRLRSLIILHINRLEKIQNHTANISDLCLLSNKDLARRLHLAEMLLY